MKKKINSIIVFLICVISANLYAQTTGNISDDGGGGYSLGNNDANHPCITPQEYKILEMQCAENIRLFGLDNKVQKRSVTTTLNWPIKNASGFNDCDYYFIGAYVDHNTATGPFQDFNCGTNSYDGHHGTDIAAWPYGFYKMDNNQVEVIAAAPGTIIQKADGNFDRNCAANTLTANSIIIQHADGSQALYWHMKKNSVTNKSVGQTVIAGEYLGVVGSSGSSSGPHLHFEVWTGNSNTTYNDPFSGTCNSINTASWWNIQKAHKNPAVIKVSVNTTDIVIPGCPTTETPNESNMYVIPFQGAGLSPGYAKFYIFIRDDATGLSADCKILNPNGSTFSSWTYTSTADSKISIRGYSKLLPTISGTYTFQATYNGITCSKSFAVTQVSGISALSAIGQVQILENPAKLTLTIAGEGMDNGNYKFTLINVAGQVEIEENTKIENNSIDKKFSISELPDGMYFLTIMTEKTKVIRKILIQNQ